MHSIRRGVKGVPTYGIGRKVLVEDLRRMRVGDSKIARTVFVIKRTSRAGWRLDELVLGGRIMSGTAGEVAKRANKEKPMTNPGVYGEYEWWGYEDGQKGKKKALKSKVVGKDRSATKTQANAAWNAYSRGFKKGRKQLSPGFVKSRRSAGRTEGGVWSRLTKSPDAKYFKNPTKKKKLYFGLSETKALTPAAIVKKGKFAVMLWALREKGPWQGRLWIGVFPTTTTATRATREGIITWARATVKKASRMKNPMDKASTGWIKAKAVRVMKGKVQIRR